LVQLSAGRDSSKATPKHHPTAGIVPSSSVASYSQRASKGLVSMASNSPVATSSAHKAISSDHYHAKDNPYSEFSSSNFSVNPSENFKTTNVPNKRYYQTINYHHRNPSFSNNEKGSEKSNFLDFNKIQNDKNEPFFLSKVHRAAVKTTKVPRATCPILRCIFQKASGTRPPCQKVFVH
jgi:hypothetical protein